MNTDWQDLMQRYSAGTITEAETLQLQEALKHDPALADTYLSFINVDVALEAAAEAGVPTKNTQASQPSSRWIQWRPIAAAAAGLAIGLFSASVVWAIAAPKSLVTASSPVEIANGSFEMLDHQVTAGFPDELGIWSGDDVRIVSGSAHEGSQKLQFVSPGADANDSQGRAISCDVFQLVDLRPLRLALSTEGESLLELSAAFQDARPANSKPSVTFFCQLFLFKGDPEALHQSWPWSNSEAISSGSAQVTTLGEGPVGWTKLTAKCLVPADADFAVIQIAARPNIRPTKLESLFADNVKLTLKTQPALPVRIVHR